MGGGEGEPASHIPGAVSDGCPAFADGCPYSKNDDMVEWIKESTNHWDGDCSILSLCSLRGEGATCHVAHVAHLSGRRSERMRSVLVRPSRKGTTLDRAVGAGVASNADGDGRPEASPEVSIH